MVLLMRALPGKHKGSRSDISDCANVNVSGCSQTEPARPPVSKNHKRYTSLQISVLNWTYAPLVLPDSLHAATVLRHLCGHASTA
ncbi:uncharacterized [Tachysurus ichikawai]